MPDTARATHLLDNLKPRGISYGLAAMEGACARRGNPERRFKSIIVAGTNGKGSTSVMLHGMLRRLGYRTGFYSSPHLIDVRERIRIDDWIPEADLAAWILRYADEGILASLTYYEALTLAAFDWFAEKGVEWAVLEVGVGGRLDAVNLAPASGSVIVSVDFDHQELLGDTLSKIAAEKAGVIKPGRPVVAGVLPPEAARVVSDRSAAQQAWLFKDGDAFTVKRSGSGFIYEGQGSLVVPELGLGGAYQSANLGCALAALERIVGVDVTQCAGDLRAALRDARWPARFQILSRSPLVVLDAAHNPAGARALAQSYTESFPGRPTTLVFASFGDKAHNESLSILRPLAHDIWITDTPGQPRAIPKEDLARDPSLEGARVELVSPGDLAGRFRGASPEAAFLVTGSLAFAGWALGHFGTL